MQYQAPKGTRDVTPEESYKWQYIEGIMRGVCRLYGYKEARTPVIEHTELFLRGVGDTTDIVQKEMYTFLDKGGRSITLKPEGTAGVARMFLENGLFNQAQPAKLFYLNCPVFRYDKPQAGRYREHHQFGIEAYGAPQPSMDAECIALAMEVLKGCGLSRLKAQVNSIGCPVCRPAYNAALKEYFQAQKERLCPTCQGRLEKNPLRILDCKEERCRELMPGAPTTLGSLCPECAGHFETLKKHLATLGVEFEVDPFIVRGLDYYTKTVFEICVTGWDYAGAVCGGGRYDGLLEQLGGPQLGGIGFGMGMERLLLVMEKQGIAIPEPEPVQVYIAARGEAAREAGFGLLAQLRRAGITAEFDHVGRSFKAQFKYAGKLNAQFVAVLGEDELKNGTVKLKRMDTGEENALELGGFVAHVQGVVQGAKVSGSEVK